jgi:predicted MFS family arabinose efflux permease
VLAALLAGAAIASVFVGRSANRVGRRRLYLALLVTMGAAGAVFALSDWLPALLLAALTGTISTDVVESGPFTSLEQAMLPSVAGDRSAARVFGTYNTIATLAGSLGALAAGLPELLDTGSARWLLAYPVAAVPAFAFALRLSPTVEVAPEPDLAPRPLDRSRRAVFRLSALFALDSFGGGFVVQAFIAYWFSRKFGTSPGTLGAVFFAVGILQAASFQAAVRLSERIGLLKTMVFTHLPSNVLLGAIAFAPNEATAIALLLGRFALSQMDVPARQAYVVALVSPSERAAAAAYTNSARYLPRPFAPLIGGAVLKLALGAPFVIGAALKIAYDVGLYAQFRKVELSD